jgi:hypothetical protein
MHVRVSVRVLLQSGRGLPEYSQTGWVENQPSIVVSKKRQEDLENQQPERPAVGSTTRARTFWTQRPADVYTMGCCGKKKLLMITTSVCACASFAFLCISLATDYWLFMSEKVKEFERNGTKLYKHTNTGLWRKCVVDGRFFIIIII